MLGGQSLNHVINNIVIHISLLWYEANKSELLHKRLGTQGRLIPIQDAESPACGGAVTVSTNEGNVMFMQPNIANWLYQALADVIVCFQAALDGGGVGPPL